MRNVRTIILAAVARRDLCYVSENKGFRFAKNKLIHADSTFIAHRSRAHFCFMKFIPINVLVPYVGLWLQTAALDSFLLAAASCRELHRA